MTYIIDRCGYDQCISLAAQLAQIAHELESVDTIEEEYLDEDEYNTIIELSQQVMSSASAMLRKAHAYVMDEVY